MSIDWDFDEASESDVEGECSDTSSWASTSECELEAKQTCRDGTEVSVRAYLKDSDGSFKVDLTQSQPGCTAKYQGVALKTDGDTVRPSQGDASVPRDGGASTSADACAAAKSSYAADNLDGTVTYCKDGFFKGLAWQQAASSRRFSWADATSYCEQLTLAGGGWRLPTLNELGSLQMVPQEQAVRCPGGVCLDQVGASISSEYFPETPMDSFWSSTASAGSATTAWAWAYVGLGRKNELSVTTKNAVRCVR